MKLKSSNRKTYILLAVLAFSALALFTFKTALTKKPTKYPAPPVNVEKKTDLDLIQISLNEKSYLKLKKKRDKALSLGILEGGDNDYVPANITFKGVNYRADIRLKGDWTDHLKGDKWSFRIKLKDDKTIHGMRKFSIHRPGARGFINEWLYHKAIKESGLIGLRYGFLEGAINIKKDNSSEYITKLVGIYAIEESFDKRTIESNARKESIILKFSEDSYWGKVKSNKAISDPSGLIWHKFMDYDLDYPITVFGEDKVLKDPTLNNYFKLSKNLLADLRSNRKTIDQVFDAKELAMQNAILNLFGATHGLPLINVRFYYNPITSKLEPIAFDGNSGAKLEDGYKHFNLINQEKDSVYLKELAYALEKISQPKYLRDLVQKHKKELVSYEKTLKTEYKYPVFKENSFWLNQEVLKKELLRLKEKYNLEDIVLTPSPSKETMSDFNISTWKKRGVLLSLTKKKHSKNPVYKLQRENTTKNAYIIITDVNVDSNKTYELSLLVKKGDVGNSFGLRMQGIYPNRADAVFNLQKGTLIGGEKTGSFKYEGASIVNQGNGWYKITLKAKADLSNIKLVFGSTTNDKIITDWEKPKGQKTNSYIDSSSLKIKPLN